MNTIETENLYTSGLYTKRPISVVRGGSSKRFSSGVPDSTSANGA